MKKELPRRESRQSPSKACIPDALAGCNESERSDGKLPYYFCANVVKSSEAYEALESIEREAECAPLRWRYLRKKAF